MIDKTRIVGEDLEFICSGKLESPGENTENLLKTRTFSGLKILKNKHRLTSKYNGIYTCKNLKNQILYKYNIQVKKSGSSMKTYLVCGVLASIVLSLTIVLIFACRDLARSFRDPKATNV